jgi:hypothetical protein
MRRCRREGDRLFCHQHRFQPWVISISIITAIGTLGGIYQDILKPSVSLVAGVQPKSDQPDLVEIVVRLESFKVDISELAKVNSIEYSDFSKSIKQSQNAGTLAERSASAFLLGNYAESVELSKLSALGLRNDSNRLEIELGNVYQITSLGLFALGKPFDAQEQAALARECYSRSGNAALERHVVVVTAGLLYQAASEGKESQTLMALASEMLGSLIENTASNDSTDDIDLLLQALFVMPGLGIKKSNELTELAEKQRYFTIGKQFSYESSIVGHINEIPINGMQVSGPTGYMTVSPNTINDLLDDFEALAKDLDRPALVSELSPVTFCFYTNLAQINLGFGNSNRAAIKLAKAITALESVSDSNIWRNIILSADLEESYPQLLPDVSERGKNSDWYSLVEDILPPDTAKRISELREEAAAKLMATDLEPNHTEGSIPTN